MSDSVSSRPLTRLVRILIVDDHQLMRAGLKKLLSDEPDMRVVAEARNAAEAIDCVRSLEIELVLLDISLPGESGLQVLPRLKQLRPQLCVLIVSMHSAAHFAARALAAGADGYINKDSAADELVSAIRQVCSNLI